MGHVSGKKDNITNPTLTSAFTLANEPTTTYRLYLYRSELYRRKYNYRRLAERKYLLTEKLVSDGIQNLSYCSSEDINDISREHLYAQLLKMEIKRIHELGLKKPRPHSYTNKL